MKNVLFLEENFSPQGSTRAMLDYALFNEKLLNNKSFIAYKNLLSRDPWDQPYYKIFLDKTINSLKTRFQTIQYQNDNELENFITSNEINAVYTIKSGEPTGFMSKNAKMLIHSVFPQPPSNIHGDRFAFVSKWLSDAFSQGKVPYVPHIINVPTIDNKSRQDIRQKLKIPDNAFVYGRIGGYHDFDLPFVYSAISQALNKRNDLYFLMICTKPFIQHERVIYVEPILDLKEKYRYISATDAMIHARHAGETFGLAIAEFCALNKPVVTWKNGIGKGYIDILQNYAIYYQEENDLIDIFMNFIPNKDVDYNAYRNYNPQNVMKKFDSVFLENL